MDTDMETGCSYHHVLLKQPSSQQARTNNCFLTLERPLHQTHAADSSTIQLMFSCQISMVFNGLCNVDLNHLQVKDLCHAEAWKQHKQHTKYQ